MIRRRQRKATREDGERFRKELDDAGVGFKDRLIMVLTAFLMIVLPSALILTAFGFLILLVFRAI